MWSFCDLGETEGGGSLEGEDREFGGGTCSLWVTLGVQLDSLGQQSTLPSLGFRGEAGARALNVGVPQPGEDRSEKVRPFASRSIYCVCFGFYHITGH